MRRVALFSTNFLEYSQTFVHEEIIHHQRYEVEVFCRKRHLPERFPFEPTHIGTPGLYSLTRQCPKFHRVFQQRPFDLVHAHFGTGACYAYPYSHRYGLPLVVTFHGYDVPLLASSERLLPTNWPYAVAAPTMLRHLTLGLCASHELFELLLEIGVPRERLRLYHLGVDLTAFKRGPRRAVPRVVMVGRFIEKKGFEYGVRGFAEALKRGAVGELTIIGTGEREAKLRGLVDELGIAHAVTFAGVLTSRDVAAYLAESDVLMAPSVVAIDGNRESGVIALKEGSACGLALLGTYHGGIPEIIEDGETGYLVPERDVAALGDRLHRLFTDRALCARLGEQGRVKIEREYNLPRQVNELESHYDEAIEIGPR